MPAAVSRAGIGLCQVLTLPFQIHRCAQHSTDASPRGTMNGGCLVMVVPAVISFVPVAVFPMLMMPVVVDLFQAGRRHDSRVRQRYGGNSERRGGKPDHHAGSRHRRKDQFTHAYSVILTRLVENHPEITPHTTIGRRHFDGTAACNKHVIDAHAAPGPRDAERRHRTVPKCSFPVPPPAPCPPAPSI
jgi:hypothetical protein